MELVEKDDSVTGVGESHRGRKVDDDDVSIEKWKIQNSNFSAEMGARIDVTKAKLSNERALDAMPGGPSPNHIMNPTSPSESTQVVPESPLNIACQASPSSDPGREKQDQILANSQFQFPSITGDGDYGKDSEEGEEFPLGEDFNVKINDQLRRARKFKRVYRRKKLDVISSHRRGGRVLQHELIRQSQKAKKKAKERKRSKGKRNHSSQEGVPEAVTASSLSDDNTTNRNEEIRKAAAKAWELGQACGMAARRPEDNVMGLFESLEERDWDAFEKRHNE